MTDRSAQTESGGPRRLSGDTAAGWIVSAVLHTGLLAALMTVAMRADSPRTTEAAMEGEAFVVAEAEAAVIEGRAPGRVRLDPPAAELAVPRLRDSTQVLPKWEVGQAGASRARDEQLISIDVGSGGDAPAAMTGDWTDFAAGGGGAGAGGASFFGLEARGEKFVFVVDRSGSMDGRKLDAAKAELLRAVRGLDRNARFYTIFFNVTHTAMPAPDLVRATEGNRRRHFEWVSGIRADDGTDPTSAMKLALSLRPDAVWLLSDGIFHPRAADEIRKANPYQRVQVHAIAFYSREGEAVLQRIAQDNRGQYRFVSPASIGLEGAGGSP